MRVAGQARIKVIMMNRKFSLKHNALMRTTLLACMVFLLPVVAGLLFVIISRAVVVHPPATLEIDASNMQITNRLHDGSAVTAPQLLALRGDLRASGVDTAEVDLRLWAARAKEPELIYKVAPPQYGSGWRWYLTHDGVHALALADKPVKNRWAAGLFSLVADKWLWTNSLPCSLLSEAPHLISDHLVLRFDANGAKFAMEIDGKGRIMSLERTGGGSAAQPAAVQQVHEPVAGKVVAHKDGLTFIAVDGDNSLQAFAINSLPGLRDAGEGNAQTVFSGNGLLKLTVDQGQIVLSAALTHTTLQAWHGWPHNTNTVVTAAQATDNGDLFNVFLSTAFDGATPIKREWSVNVNTYAGTIKRNLNPDVQFARPEPVGNKVVVNTPDGRWLMVVNKSNELLVTTRDGRPVTKVDLKPLGLREPVRNLLYLADGRHLVLYQDRRVWLLDYAIATTYGGLVARAANASSRVSMAAWRVKRETSDDGSDKTQDAQLALDEEGFGVAESYDADELSFGIDTNAVAPSWLGMRTEMLVANGIWSHAAATLEMIKRLQAWDSRAPRVNPLLMARCQILAGQREQARATCRDALRTLMTLPATYDFMTGEYKPVKNVSADDNRMIRYQLQGLLFAE